MPLLAILLLLSGAVLHTACRTESTDVQLNDEAEEHVWVRLDAAMQLPMDSYTRFAVEKLIK